MMAQIPRQLQPCALAMGAKRRFNSVTIDKDIKGAENVANLVGYGDTAAARK